eukprot:scaffold3063_cov191-Amphora_coffeaeformis.AAC.3
MSVVLTPDQQCASSTLDLLNNSTDLETAGLAIEALIAEDVRNLCVNDRDVVCIISEDAEPYANATATYTQACEAAGGVILLDYDVNTTCLSAEDLSPDTAQYNIHFRHVDVCAAPTDCEDSMVDFLFLSKGTDIFNTLREMSDVPLVCFDTDNCSFVRSDPGVSVEIGLLPGCPTVAPTTMPTDSGAMGNNPMAMGIMAWMMLAAGLFW